MGESAQGSISRRNVIPSGGNGARERTMPEVDATTWRTYYNRHPYLFVGTALGGQRLRKVPCGWVAAR
jgi:hypothetical protein